MNKPLLLVLCMLMNILALGQSARVVTGARANGTYRHGGSEFRVLALGRNKLRLQLNLMYEYKSPYGPMANLGETAGEATIENDVAIFHPPDSPNCSITIKFLPGNKIKVTQDGDSADCGFGNRVFADGTYVKIKAGRPKFQQ